MPIFRQFSVLKNKMYVAYFDIQLVGQQETHLVYKNLTATRKESQITVLILSSSCTRLLREGLLLLLYQQLEPNFRFS